MQIPTLIILLYLAALNLAGFLSMGIDKRRARRNRWRIPEAALFGIALLGGSLGSIAGMRVFHHKTKHWYFRYGMPLILLLQVILGVLLSR